MSETKLDRLRLLIDSLVVQVQAEQDPKRKAKLAESAETLTKRYTEEKGKEQDEQRINTTER